ncbi:DUF1573 domain-containing protein [Sediminitomix flava]|uniref:Uncharacterized protein DUF1573 n=1 Tax=Sediminitomix flava TaxID=379075 RepID=A0A315ZHD3_SEDFL|nr:DUF1573 domain-containing protein [Sediminitomix flava]PWJ44702.1 uncharacterized protein DUF1573 [Sediminitomix flava]
MKTSNIFSIKKLFLIVAFSLIGLQLQAQGKVEFEEVSFNFGDIKEENGPVTHIFKFKNSGNAPVKLTSVKASCGCTTPKWTQDPVLPNKDGEITVSYNPKKRPGAFTKTITVRSTGDPELTVLRISGKVSPSPKGPKDIYPMEIGNLRFKTTYISFGKVFHDQSDTSSTVLYNQGSQPIKIDMEATKLPKHLTMTSESDVVEPNKTLRLSFKYDAAEKADWGYVFDHFKLVTNDAEDAEKRINVSAHIQENFSEVEASTAPKITFSELRHNFGDVAPRSKNHTMFKITNEGESVLLIRKTKASCGCTATKPNKTVLKAGESTEIEVTYTAGSHPGNVKKSLTVICNDPKQPETTLWIEGNIKEGGK